MLVITMNKEPMQNCST